MRGLYGLDWSLYNSLERKGIMEVLQASKIYSIYSAEIS